MEATHSDWHDPKHGWENGVQTKLPPSTANERLFGPIDMQYVPNSNWRRIPEVSAVTRFMIRRQFRHYFEPWELEYILSRFSRLTDFIYEPWPFEYTSIYLGPWERALIPTGMPETLKRLTIFQDSKQYLTERALQDRNYVSISPEYMSEFDFVDITKSTAQTSLTLDELSVSFYVDAMNFFEACEEEWTWDHLKSLSLTSSLLFRSIKGQDQRIDSLLLTAAKFLLRMPNLTTMVLWN
nr:hypothetical protein FVER53263_07472 [Fusarium verticillioides]